PQPRSCAIRAVPIAPRGMTKRTASVSRTTRPRLPDQRKGLDTVRRRRGARASHAAIPPSTAAKQASRITDSWPRRFIGGSPERRRTFDIRRKPDSSSFGFGLFFLRISSLVRLPEGARRTNGAPDDTWD